MESSAPARGRTRITPRKPAKQPEYTLSFDPPETDNQAPVVKPQSWHMWGMMVGFMAAGAAVLAILSFQGA